MSTGSPKKKGQNGGQNGAQGKKGAAATQQSSPRASATTPPSPRASRPTTRGRPSTRPAFLTHIDSTHPGGPTLSADDTDTVVNPDPRFRVPRTPSRRRTSSDQNTPPDTLGVFHSGSSRKSDDELPRVRPMRSPTPLADLHVQGSPLDGYYGYKDDDRAVYRANRPSWTNTWLLSPRVLTAAETAGPHDYDDDDEPKAADDARVDEKLAEEEMNEQAEGSTADEEQTATDVFGAVIPTSFPHARGSVAAAVEHSAGEASVQVAPLAVAHPEMQTPPLTSGSSRASSSIPSPPHELGHPDHLRQDDAEHRAEDATDDGEHSVSAPANGLEPIDELEDDDPSDDNGDPEETATAWEHAGLSEKAAGKRKRAATPSDDGEGEIEEQAAEQSDVEEGEGYGNLEVAHPSQGPKRARTQADQAGGSQNALFALTQAGVEYNYDVLEGGLLDIQPASYARDSQSYSQVFSRQIPNHSASQIVQPQLAGPSNHPQGMQSSNQMGWLVPRPPAPGMFSAQQNGVMQTFNPQLQQLFHQAPPHALWHPANATLGTLSQHLGARGGILQHGWHASAHPGFASQAPAQYGQPPAYNAPGPSHHGPVYAHRGHASALPGHAPALPGSSFAHHDHAFYTGSSQGGFGQLPGPLPPMGYPHVQGAQYSLAPPPQPLTWSQPRAPASYVPAPSAQANYSTAQPGHSAAQQGSTTHSSSASQAPAPQAAPTGATGAQHSQTQHAIQAPAPPPPPPAAPAQASASTTHGGATPAARPRATRTRSEPDHSDLAAFPWPEPATIVPDANARYFDDFLISSPVLTNADAPPYMSKCKWGHLGRGTRPYHCDHYFDLRGDLRAQMAAHFKREYKTRWFKGNATSCAWSGCNGQIIKKQRRTMLDHVEEHIQRREP
ncbi:hypothetical protein HDZ31DRAFT_63390 [Schizophyllum fasciatum]